MKKYEINHDMSSSYLYLSPNALIHMVFLKKLGSTTADPTGQAAPKSSSFAVGLQEFHLLTTGFET
jgi:hypothetical protein